MFSYQTIANKSYSLCLYFAIFTAIAAPISTAATSIGCALMLITWLISGKALESLKISYQQPVGKMLLLFFAWLFIGMLYADNNWTDKWDTLLSWKKLAYFFILLGLFYHQEWKRRFINAYVFVMIIGAAAAAIFWSMDIIIRPVGSGGPGIFMTNYVSQSMAFIAALVACIFLLQNSNSQAKKYFFSLAILLLAFNVFFTSSARSGYVALVFTVVFSIGSIYGIKKLPHIISICSIILVLLFFSSNNLQQRVFKGLGELASVDSAPTLSSIGIRMVFAKNTLELIKDEPVFGYGTSSFKPVYSSHVANIYNKNDWRSAAATDPHNIYLFIWLENGLIGLLIFFSFIYLALRQGLEQAPYGKIAAGFFIAICASSLFNSHFKTFPEGHLLAFFTGILLSQYKPSASPKTAAAS